MRSALLFRLVRSGPGCVPFVLGEYSAWAVWDGDTTLVAPTAPVPVLSFSYVGANLSIKWEPVAGDPTYVVRIFPDGHVDSSGKPSS